MPTPTPDPAAFALAATATADAVAKQGDAESPDASPGPSGDDARASKDAKPDATREASAEETTDAASDASTEDSVLGRADPVPEGVAAVLGPSGQNVGRWASTDFRLVSCPKDGNPGPSVERSAARVAVLDVISLLPCGFDAAAPIELELLRPNGLPAHVPEPGEDGVIAWQPGVGASLGRYALRAQQAGATARTTFAVVPREDLRLILAPFAGGPAGMQFELSVAGVPPLELLTIPVYHKARDGSTLAAYRTTVDVQADARGEALLKLDTAADDPIGTYYFLTDGMDELARERDPRLSTSDSFRWSQIDLGLSLRGPTPGEGAMSREASVFAPVGFAPKDVAEQLVVDARVGNCRWEVEPSVRLTAQPGTDRVGTVWVGQSVQLCLTGFPPGREVVARVLGPDEAGEIAARPLEVRDDGTSTFTWRPMPDDPLGEYRMQVQDTVVRSDATESAFQVVAEADAAIFTVPSTGVAGDDVTLVVAQRAPDSVVRVDVYRADEGPMRDGGLFATLDSARYLTSLELRTDARGHAVERIPTRADDPAGEYVFRTDNLNPFGLDEMGMDSGLAIGPNAARFTLQRRAIEVWPPEGPPGTTFHIRALGLPPEADVEFEVLRMTPSGTTERVGLLPVRTFAEGGARATIYTAADDPPGTFVISVVAADTVGERDAGKDGADERGASGANESATWRVVEDG